MLKIGLTGGIGSGKSMVANCFAALNVPVLDADQIALSLTKSGGFCYNQTVAHFGQSYLAPDGSLYRRKIRDTIFANKRERLWLENLLHPHIKEQMEKTAESIVAPYGILVIPLLWETKHIIKVDRTLVVDCIIAKQLQRLIKRDHYTISEARTIIKLQVGRSSRLKKADDIIYNNGSIQILKKAINFLHHYYLSITQKYDIL